MKASKFITMITTPIMQQVNNKGLKTSLFILAVVMILGAITSPTSVLATSKNNDKNDRDDDRIERQTYVVDESEDAESDEVNQVPAPTSNATETNEEPGILPEILNYFFGDTDQTATDTSTSSPIVEEEVPITPVPAPVVKPTPSPKPSNQKATSTAGVVTTDTNSTLKQAEEASLAKSSQVNPLLNFWKKDSSSYDIYMYAGLGTVTTLFLLLLALVLGASGFSMILRDTLSQSSFSKITTRSLQGRSFKSTLVSNH